MLALVLMALGTFAVIELFHRAQQGNADGEHVFIATHAAQECLETLRNLAYGSLTVGIGVLSSVTGCSASPSGLPAPTDGTPPPIRSVTVTEPATNLKQIAVTISWAAPGGTTNVALQTYRSAN